MKHTLSFSLTSSSSTTMTVFEELELLESLRTHLEERQSKAVQFALFDAMFGPKQHEASNIKMCPFN